MTHVEGYLAPGFEEVGEVFEQNFQRFGEIGAAFAATVDGSPVVDLWGGLADRQKGRPWEKDTLQLIFSGTKGITAICLLMLVDRHLVDLDEPVSRYWTAFGKESVLVRDLATHSARLPGFSVPVSLDELTNDLRLAHLLAQQSPVNDDRAAFCYHPITYGWLIGELLRHVDGRSIGRFFAEEVAQPLDLDVWIGLPAEEESRVTRLELAPNWGISAHFQPEVYERDALMRMVWANPEMLTHRAFPWNRTDFHSCEMPGVNGIATARSMAKLYGVLACGGAPLMSEETVRLGRSTLKSGLDALYNEQRRFGVGFQLQTDSQALGPALDAFGHGGAGGSMHGAWPGKRVGFSYTMNYMRDGDLRDPRSSALLEALDRAVA